MQLKHTKLPGGGVTTVDPKPGDSLSPNAAMYYYKYKTTATPKKEDSFPLFSNGFETRSLMPLLDDACDVSPERCYNNMADYTFPMNRIVKRAPATYAKTIRPIPGFHDVGYSNDKADKFADDFDDDGAKCTGTTECLDEPTACNYIAFYPSGIDYSTCQLPCVLLFHAGGHSDCSNYNYEDTLCINIARKGFIVFLVEYRRGRIKDSKDNGIYTSAQQMLALYRAFQDGRGAIRTIIQRQRNIATNGLPYQIDTSKIFVAGQSAGGSIANSLAYYKNQTMINAVFPVPSGELSMQTVLGDIDADFYIGSPNIEYQSKIRGLWCMWGGFSIPTIGGNSVDEYNFLTQNGTDNNLVPMIGFMGKFDQVFPLKIEKQSLFYPPQRSPHNIYTNETRCLINSPFNIYNNDLDPDANLRIECTNDIYNLFKAHNIPALEYLDCFMLHGLDHVKGWEICSTDFGNPAPVTLNQVNEYMAGRACFFFQSILNGTASMLKEPSKFTNCLDKRHTIIDGVCTIEPENNTCSNEDTCTHNPE